MYLRYGGKKIETIDKNELVKDVTTMRVYQLVVSLLVIISAIFIKDFAWFAFAVAILPLNMVSYYKLLCQATGEFQKYGIVTNIITFLTFAINISLVFLINIRETAIPYIILYVGLDVLIWLGTEKYMVKVLQIKGIRNAVNFALILQNIKDGILLTLGNLSTTLLTGMDRWFVKLLMNTVTFAQYSFAVSIESFLNVAVTPVSITLYNYFCNHNEKKEIEKVQNYVIAFATVLPICAFPAKWILEKFLLSYIESASVLFFLFAAHSYAIIVKCVYINLYKAKKQQSRYFGRLIMVLVVGFFLNIVCYLMIRTKEAFAIGTLLSMIFWLILSIADFKEVKLSLKVWAYLILETCVFLLCGYVFGAIQGCLIYGGCTVVLMFALMRETTMSLLLLIKKIYKEHIIR